MTIAQSQASQDERWMKRALQLAHRAGQRQEVPVGAVLIDANGNYICGASNTKEATNDPTAHAEINVIQKATRKLEAWRLTGCTLYVTLEPCPMCIGAMLQARIHTLVFGCSDPKAGATGSLYNLHDDKRLNHQVDVRQGVFSNQCADLLKDFFRQRRK